MREVAMPADPYESEDYAALIRHMRTDDSDLARLVAADWLEENGEDKRAAMIRHKVEKGERTPLQHGFGMGVVSHLLEGHAGQVMAPITTVVVAEPILHVSLFASRGFACGATCDLGRWIVVGPELCRAHPIRGVTITGRWCAGHEAGSRLTGVVVGWVEHERWFEEDFRLPPPICKFLTGVKVDHPARIMTPEYHYRSVRQAEDDMGRACLEWARAEADRVEPHET